MNRRPRRSGFVLLLVLVLVMLAGVALAVVARQSVAAAVEARTEVEQWQRRWAVRSSRAAFYGRIESVLDTAERGRSLGHGRADRPTNPARRGPEYRNDPTPVHRVACRLAGIDYELVFTDEQAGLNVNRLLKRRTRGQAQQQVQRLVTPYQPPSADERVQVRLRPMADKDTSTQMPSLGSYSQVFDNVTARQLVGQARGRGVAQPVTCWGADRVNIRRAPDRVIRAQCDREISGPLLQQLLAIRDEDPYRSLNDMLSELDHADADERQRLRRYLTDTSRTHGLWVICRGSQRMWYSLTIEVAADRSPDRLIGRYEFTW
ncbi:MAG: general secretion pathway protein GspK [Phycisphaerae bacterium]|nr:general secretion pathway protein GspK [Phycisphaerae bacterium]